MTLFLSNIKAALRGLIKRPRFSLAVITILTLAIGANTAIYSVMYTVLQKPMEPYDHPERIVVLKEILPENGINFDMASMPTIDFWKEHCRSFETIVGCQLENLVQVTINDQTFSSNRSQVSSGFFSLAGMEPALGRGFLPEEETAGNEHVVVLSDKFWRRHFDADPNVVGRTLLLNKSEYTIVGVLSPSLGDLFPVKNLWVPLVLNKTDWKTNPIVYARLKPGISLARARAELQAAEASLSQLHPRERKGYTAEVSRVIDNRFVATRAILYPIWTAVGLILLITCLNVSGLILVRGESRKKEIAIRAALGATRRQNMAHVLTEGILLSIIAGGLGLLLAHCLIKTLAFTAPVLIAHLDETKMNVRALTFTLIISVLTGLFSGLVPAWRATGGQLSEIIKQGSGSRSQHHHRFKNLLVIAQCGIALSLIFAVALIKQSLVNICSTDLGFRPDNLLCSSIFLSKKHYPTVNDRFSFFHELQNRIKTLPGVEKTAFMFTELNLGSGHLYTELTIDGKSPLPSGQKPLISVRAVGYHFFDTMGMTFLKGRGFSEQECGQGARVVIIDETLARKYFPDNDPLGRDIKGHRIIGIVKPLKDFNSPDPDSGTLYLTGLDPQVRTASLVIRASANPASLVEAVNQQVSELGPTLPKDVSFVIEDYLTEMLTSRRYMARLLSLFAGMALLLATVGIFGLLQYSVSQSTHEIGIRMALGATHRCITHMFLKRAILVLLPGVGLGLIGGYAVQKFLASQLYNVSLADPRLLAAACGILACTGLLASWLPTRRAAKTTPMEALRYE